MRAAARRAWFRRWCTALACCAAQAFAFLKKKKKEKTVRIISSTMPWGFGYPKGSAAELLDGALKFRYCVTPFSKRFPTWSSPPIGNGEIRDLHVATNQLDGGGGNIAERVRLTKKTQGSVTPVIPDHGHSTSRRWKRLRLLRRSGE